MTAHAGTTGDGAMCNGPIGRGQRSVPRARRWAGTWTVALLSSVVAATMLPLASVPAQAEDEIRTAAGQSVPVPVVEEIAALVDQPLSKVRDLLRSDDTMRVDEDGRLYHADTFEMAASARTASFSVARPDHALSRTFSLHSRSGSRRVIYLDFTGERVCDTAWNSGGLLGLSGLPCGTYEGYDFDGRSGFSDSELAAVQEIWARVAEDYAPFNVDVTTQRPSAERISKTSAGDMFYGVHAVVSSSTEARNATCGGPGCAGVAYVGIYNDRRANDQRILWTFPEEVGNNPRIVADVLSHEAGHTLSLLHDGNTVDAYDQGHGIWAPIMGASSRRALTQWSRGEYQGANNREDDVAIIASHGTPYRADDHAGWLAAASRINPSSTRSGVIARRNDRDIFKLRTRCRSTLNVRVRNVRFGPNLDIRLRLYNNRGQLIATRNPTSSSSGAAGGLNADFSGVRGASTHYIVVDGTGARDPQTTGYSNYGSLGAYKVRYSSRCGARW